ncbi:hypothetical protein ACSBR1_007106 [Camellia fascicularis]
MSRGGGWIPVLRQRRGGGAQGNEARHGVVTVFVDNIPSAMAAKALFKLFSNFGIVKEAFIPYKRRQATNSRFGFVRYDCQVVAAVAIQKGNSLLVDDKVLEVKVAAYDRNNRGEQGRGKPQHSRKAPHINNFSGKAALVGHRSFAEVLKGDIPSTAEEESIEIQAFEEGNGWLYDSAIIRFNTEYPTHIISKALKKKGWEQVVVRKGGGRDIILSFKSQAELHTNIDQLKDWFKDWSLSVSEWKPGFHLQPERCVWLRCFGIPLNLWNRNTLNNIGRTWGSVLSLEGDLCQPKSFSHARIRVVTGCMEYINRTVNLKCNGSSHPVLICENHPAFSDCLDHNGLEEFSSIGNCYSNESRNVSGTDVRIKNDGDGAVAQRQGLSVSHIGEVVDTVVEETLAVGGFNREKETSVEEPLLEGSDRNSKSNDDNLRCIPQVYTPGFIKNFNEDGDGPGHGTNLEELSAMESRQDFGPGINLEVVLARSLNKFSDCGPSNRPKEVVSTKQGNFVSLASSIPHMQSAGPNLSTGKSFLTLYPNSKLQ